MPKIIIVYGIILQGYCTNNKGAIFYAHSVQLESNITLT